MPDTCAAIFLVATTQRCGSTWLTRILEQMTGTTCRYINGWSLGYRLRKQSADEAPAAMAALLRSTPEVAVFKTHDLPSKDFDRLCGTMPELRLLTMSRDFKDVVVSRYFYYRYYWMDDPTLGPFPAHLGELFSILRGMDDRSALARLLHSPQLRGWAEEWTAFEGDFTAATVRRVRYEDLLDGSENEALAAFCGHPFPPVFTFAEQQRAETIETGRRGRQRFFRRGRSRGWTQWFDEVQGRELNALVEPAAVR